MKKLFQFVLTTVVGLVVCVGLLFSVFFITSAIGIIGEMIFNFNPVREDIHENVKLFVAGTYYILMLLFVAMFLFLAYAVGKNFVTYKKD